MFLRFQLCFVDEVDHIVQKLTRGGGHVNAGEGQTLQLQQKSWCPVSRCSLCCCILVAVVQERLQSPLSKARSSLSQAATPRPTGAHSRPIVASGPWLNMHLPCSLDSDLLRERAACLQQCPNPGIRLVACRAGVVVDLGFHVHPSGVFVAEKRGNIVNVLLVLVYQVYVMSDELVQI